MDQAFVDQLTKWIEIYGYGGAVLLFFVICVEMLLRQLVPEYTRETPAQVVALGAHGKSKGVA